MKEREKLKINSLLRLDYLYNKYYAITIKLIVAIIIIITLNIMIMCKIQISQTIHIQFIRDVYSNKIIMGIL